MADEKTFTQAEFDAALAKMQESVDKLEAKNVELVADLRKARKAGEIKPEDLAAAEDRADKAEARAADLDKQVKTLTTERDKAVKSLEAESGYTSKLLTENGLTAALTEAGVKEPALLKAAKALLGGNLQVVTEGDQRVVKAGDKALADFVKEWAGSDEAKHFITAANNNGGGAPGGKGGSSGKQVTRTQFDAMSIDERMTFSKEGGQVVDAA